MNNYTYEQRQMIADYIENVFLKYCVVDEISLDDEEILEFKFHLAHEKIAELKTTTFGDIKNQIGVKFKEQLFAGDNVLIIAEDRENKPCIYCPANFTVYESRFIKDTEIVEVLNEN